MVAVHARLCKWLRATGSSGATGAAIYSLQLATNNSEVSARLVCQESESEGSNTREDRGPVSDAASSVGADPLPRLEMMLRGV